MSLRPIDQIADRLDLARDDSDVAAFVVLLFYGEAVLKLTTAGLMALLDDDEGHQYRLEYDLVRADSPGSWARVIEDLTVGPAATARSSGAEMVFNELTERLGDDGDWRLSALQSLYSAIEIIDATLVQNLPTRSALRHWFNYFAILRNRTRGHGSFTDSKVSLAAPLLEESIRSIVDNLKLFHAVEWGYIKQQMSGRYRVVPISDSPTPQLSEFFGASAASHEDGVYLWAGRPRSVRLLTTDASLIDFFYPNGNYRRDRYEVLSYVTDDTRQVDATRYRLTPAFVPGSETEGSPNLTVVGEVFTNMPEAIEDYVDRPGLESELRAVLADERNPVITLHGRGGIGKTSLAIEVLHRIAESGDFFTILWLSARDIDLLPEGPRVVRPRVVELAGMADLCAFLLNEPTRSQKGFDSDQYLSDVLAGNYGGPHLLVIDNFETVTNPLEVYHSVNNAVRLPNKILITSRHRDFRGDYAIEVPGMEREEFSALVERAASRLKIAGQLPSALVDELHEQAGGHPYVAKVMLGELATTNAKTVAPLMARRGDILDALFERTYTTLSLAERRVFLTLCSWRSSVPVVALEAALLRPGNERIDVESSVERLNLYSLIEIAHDPVSEEDILSVPVAAQIFGKQKLAASPLRTAVEADREILQMFGAAQGSDMRGVGGRVERFFRTVSDRLRSDTSLWDQYLPMLDYVAFRVPQAWLYLADLYRDRGVGTSMERARHSGDFVRSYLERNPEDREAWAKLAVTSREALDPLSEVNALLRLAELPTSEVRDAAYAAERLMTRLQADELTMDSAERRLIVERLVDLIELRIEDASASDLSRAAWLSLHLQDTPRARRHVERGLKLESDNLHLLRLERRLDRQGA